MSCPDGFQLEIRAEGDVCRGEQPDGLGAGWTCPRGCVQTGAPPSCQALGIRGHCLGSPCRVQDVVSCLDRYARYEPLDLPGEGRSQETNVRACQQRCASVAACSHFSFFRDGGCHLQDSSAGLVPDEDAFCGPPRCASSSASEPVPQITSWLIDRSSLPLQVRGSHLLSVDGQHQVLACVNWYGAHMEMLVNNGLNVRSLTEVANHIVELKFNCVRLPYSLDSLNLSAASIPNPASQLCHNPELQASTPLQIFDSTVQALTDAGLLVVLNNHVSNRGWCCDASDGEGLWYTKDFPESVWLDHLSFLAARYRDNARVVGFDIRNEIRSTEDETPTWGPGRGAQSGGTTDWAEAASKGSRRVLDANPDMLLFISGLEYSMFLCDVPQRPLHMEPGLEGHIIYTTHEYDWYKNSIQTLYESGQILCGFFAACGALLLVVSLATVLYSAARQVAIVPRRRLCCWPKLRGLYFEVALAMLFVAAFLLSLLVVAREVMDPCQSGELHVVSFPTLVILPLWLVGLLFSGRLSCLLLRTFRPVSAIAMDEEKPSPVSPDRVGGREVGIEMSELNRVEGDTPQNLNIMTDQGKEHLQYALNQKRASVVVLAMLFLICANAAALLFLQSYEAWQQSIDDRWGFLLQPEPNAEGAAVAAVWLGEFGTATDTTWWRNMLRYLGSRPVVGWAYWPLNGEKRPGELETYGILHDDMRTIRHPWKLADLQHLLSKRLNPV
ncbi:unnamed protein product [Symbiodinium sp. CCMP2592]|nr:unnamed protein product [Symbiodinium sp. CCMP2592]